MSKQWKIRSFGRRMNINPQQRKVFGKKFSLRENRRIFPIKLRNFKLWKIQKLLNVGFPEG